MLLGMLGGVLKERRPVSEPFIALLAGVLIGPAVFGLLDLAGQRRTGEHGGAERRGRDIAGALRHDLLLGLVQRGMRGG